MREAGLAVPGSRSIRRARWRLAVACAAALLFAPPALWPHIPTYGVGTAIQLIFREDGVRITFDLSYDGYWAQAEMVAIDTDRTGSIESREAGAYLSRQWEKKILPRIRILLDGREVSPRKDGERHEGLVGEVYAVPFSLYYDLEVDLPAGESPGTAHVLEFEDRVVRDETPARPRFFIPYEGHGTPGTSRFVPRIEEPRSPMLETGGYLAEGEKLVVSFRFEPADGAPTGSPAGAPGGEARNAKSPPAPAPDGREQGTPSGAPRPSESPAAAERSGTTGSGLPEAIETALRSTQPLSWYQILIFVLLATLAGAGHALAPGHGKAMVAAYLIGSRGRIRDAVTLGLATTLTHTGSVFVFGLTLFLLVSRGAQASEAALQSRVIVALQLASGALLFILGLSLFLRRVRRGWYDAEATHSHDHHHGHSHDHHHGHPHDRSHDPPHEDHLEHLPGPSHAHHDEDESEPAHDHPHGAGHDPSHDHPHEHPHDHPHDGPQDPPREPSPADPPEVGAAKEAAFLDGGRPRMRDLVALGISGGLVPCPAGLTVILIGLHFPDKLLFALFLLVFFSVGLGSVLVAIGVALISGKAIATAYGRPGAFFQELTFLERRFPRSFLARLDAGAQRALRVLPALSALFIAGLGVVFCATTVATGRTELAAILRALADWLQGRA